MPSFYAQHFLVYGALDTLFNILSTWPVEPLGGTVANVLSQTVLPMNMLLSFLMLKTRYGKVHLVGATLAIYGVLIRLSPAMMGDESDGGSAKGGAVFLWALVLVVSQIPSALSNGESPTSTAHVVHMIDVISSSQF